MQKNPYSNALEKESLSFNDYVSMECLKMLDSAAINAWYIGGIKIITFISKIPIHIKFNQRTEQTSSSLGPDGSRLPFWPEDGLHSIPDTGNPNSHINQS